MDHRLQVGDTQLAPIEAPLGQRLQFGHNQGGRRGGEVVRLRLPNWDQFYGSFGKFSMS